MNWSAPRNALAAAVLALTGVLLIAAGFLAATIVLDDRDTEATAATVLEATANPGDAGAGRRRRRRRRDDLLRPHRRDHCHPRGAVRRAGTCRP